MTTLHIKDGELRDAELQIAIISIHQHKKTLVDIALSPRREKLPSRTAQDIAERSGDGIAPILFGGFGAIRRHPGDILEPFFRDDFAAKKPGP